MIRPCVDHRKVAGDIAYCKGKEHSVNSHKLWLEIIGQCVENRKVDENVGYCTWNTAYCDYIYGVVGDDRIVC